MAKKVQEKSSINKPMPPQMMGISKIVKAAKAVKAIKSSSSKWMD